MKLQRMMFLFLLLLLSIGSSADSGTPQQSIFDILHQQEILKVSLELPLQYLNENRRDTNDHTAKFSFVTPDGQVQEWKAEVSLRGRFRRMRCTEIPPLKIKFKKKHLSKAGLAAYNDMKLVAYCKDDSEASKAALIKEYLAYKLYNEVTTASYRVQLIEITYKDIYNDQSKTQYAFLIEDTAQLRARLGAQKATQFRYLTPDIFQEKARRDVAMFQYLIGNTDWDFKGPRNVKYLVKEEKIIPVPYDFDFSGFVYAPYALLTSIYGQTSLKDRVWLGFDEDRYLLKAPKKRFAELESTFQQIIKQTKLLDKESRKELTTYVSAYFKDDLIIDEPQAVGE